MKFRAESAEGAERRFSASSAFSARTQSGSPVQARKSLRQAQAERNRWLPSPAQAEPVEAGEWFTQRRGAEREARSFALAATRRVPSAFSARKEWKTAEPKAQPLRAFSFCFAPLREPIRVGLPAQRRVECAYGAALDCFVAALFAMTGWIGFRAESAEAISLRSLRSLRETNQNSPVPARKSLRQAQAERNRCLPNPRSG